jgi:hypothetical protein
MNGRTVAYFALRLTPELKRRIEVMAKEEERSTNSQIIWLLGLGMRSPRRRFKSEEAAAA